jgi:hypothetical protein
MKNVKDPFTKVYVSGTFNNWSGDANELTDANGDKIYEGTISAVAPGKHEFKYQLDAWAKSEQFKGGEPCTITDPSGQFVNRKMEVNGDSTLTAFCYNECATCKVGTNDVFTKDLIQVQPTIANEMVTVTFSEGFDAQNKQINILSLDGRVVASYFVKSNTRQQIIPVSELPNGLYLLQAKVGTLLQMEKVVVSH